MEKGNIMIRLEKKEEQRKVENLVRDSFWNVYRPGCLEHYVLHQLRNEPTFVPELDFVMLLKENYALDLLTSYWFQCGRPREWLFPACRKKGAPYNPTAFSNKFVKYRKKFHWNQELTCHSFRHAFGTHLYENGTDLLTIKELLGHKSLLSTTIYIHLANNGVQSAVSPFDQFGGDIFGK